MSEALAIGEAARRCGLTRGALHQAIRRGTLDAAKRGGRWEVTPEALAAWREGSNRIGDRSIAVWVDDNATVRLRRISRDKRNLPPEYRAVIRARVDTRDAERLTKTLGGWTSAEHTPQGHPRDTVLWELSGPAAIAFLSERRADFHKQGKITALIAALPDAGPAERELLFAEAQALH